MRQEKKNLNIELSLWMLHIIMMLSLKVPNKYCDRSLDFGIVVVHRSYQI